MFDIDSITSQVKHNCDISDAKYWGYYSPCGLLLRLRDLYKFEHALRPWEPIDHRRIKKWIEEKEQLWAELEQSEFQRIEINGKSYDPFDSRKINGLLTGQRYVYSAGYGNMLKPVFVLSGLEGDFKKGRFRIYYSGRELARDLSTSPAMIQGNTVFSRVETMAHFFWGKYEEMRSRRCSGALSLAFSEYGITKDGGNRAVSEKLGKTITRIARDELATYIYHEFGEASQRRTLGTWWKELLAEMPYSRAELFLRALKDIRADTCNAGMLAHIIKERKTASLHFYLALLSGFRKILFSDIVPASERFMTSEDWRLIEEARVKGYKRAGEYVMQLKAMYDNGRASVGAIENELIPQPDIS